MCRVNVKSLACTRRRNWDITAIALTIYTLLVLPFRAAFYWEYYRDLEMHHNVIEQLEVHSTLEEGSTSCLRKSTECRTASLAPDENTCTEHSTLMLLQVDWMLLIELLIDLFFLSDIALNFNTGYIFEQVVQCSQLFALGIRRHNVDEVLICTP